MSKVVPKASYVSRDFGQISLLGSLIKRGFRQNFINELGIPLSAAFVAFLVASILSDPEHREVISVLWAVVVHGLVYMVLVFFRIETEVKRPGLTIQDPDKPARTVLSPDKLEELIKSSSAFFCTSVVPEVLPEFKVWFESEILVTHTILTNRCLLDPKYKACRVLVFKNERQLRLLGYREHPEGLYAWRVAKIHMLSHIDLAFMTYATFYELCVAAQIPSDLRLREHDFFILDGSDGDTLQVAVDVLKRSPWRQNHEIGYGPPSCPDAIPVYKELKRQIISKIYSGDILDKDYNFYLKLKTTMSF